MTADRLRHRRTLGALALALTASLSLAACAAGSGTGPPAPAGPPVQGGTAYFAEQPLSPPSYIFPLISGQYYSAENTADFQTLLYRPLYWYGDEGRQERVGLICARRLPGQRRLLEGARCSHDRATAQRRLQPDLVHGQ